MTEKENSAKKKGISFYDDIYTFGLGYCNFFKKFFGTIFHAVGRFFRFIFIKISAFFVLTGRFFSIRFKIAARAIKKFAGEVRRSLPVIHSRFKESPKKGFSEFFGYASKFFHSHKRFNKALVSTVIPVVAVILLIEFIVMCGGLTFAVSVDINGKNVGTVSDESVFAEAKTEAMQRLVKSDGSSINAAPVYNIVLTTVNSLTNKEAVCNNIIEAVSDNTFYACGVYVDGNFLCSVDCRNTLDRVMNTVLGDYKKENNFTTDNYKVEFSQTINGVPGYYPKDDSTWTASKLFDYLVGNKTDGIEHVVKEDETLDTILKKYNITSSALAQLNPELETDNIPVGSTLLIKKAVRNVSIKTTVTYLKTENIPFTTIKQNDNTLTIGLTRTIVAGADGQDVVSYTDTYVDGEKISSKHEVVRYNAKTAVNALIRIGTNGNLVTQLTGSSSPRLYKIQGGKFLWPAPDNCFWLSQGYNPGNSHYGIDIVSSDDGSSKGRRIVAVADGVVITATYHYSWGYYIRVDHGEGVVTGYAHALEGSFRVNVGDYVKAGQQLSSIGTTGNSTGYHLHFEVWLDGTRVNPLPYVYSDITGITLSK